jgi:hypothetical protein
MVVPMSIKTTIVLGGLAVGVILTLPVRASAQNDRYGIHTSYLSPFLARKASDLGTGYVRIVIEWTAVQPNGPDDWSDFYLRDWLSNARANRLKLYATLGTTPAWAGPCPQCMPDSRWSWYNFVYRLMRELKTDYPNVEVVFGIWNDPNLTGVHGFFQGTDTDLAYWFSSLTWLGGRPIQRRD